MRYCRECKYAYGEWDDYWQMFLCLACQDDLDFEYAVYMDYMNDYGWENFWGK